MSNEVTTPRSPSLLRDYASILVCAMIVFASISLGFVQIAIKVIFGQEVQFDASWNANLSAMASMALGALIQQKMGGTSTAPFATSGNVNFNVPADTTSSPSVGVVDLSPAAQQPAPTLNTVATSQEICPCCEQPITPGVVVRDPGPAAFKHQ